MGERPQTFQSGEIPTVQERFQAIIKRRLQDQIIQNPPLFPWETQLVEYPECVEEQSPELVPIWAWTLHQSKLNLPIPLPEKVFWQLLEKAHVLLASPVPLGAKLVQVVESMFPKDTQTINDLAGLVLRSSYRSADTLTAPNIESDYFDLLPRQQMALSLMAAKQLLENLTLPISSTQPLVERQWLTTVGTLSIRVELWNIGKFTKLIVEGELPIPGILHLQANNTQDFIKSETSEIPIIELQIDGIAATYTLAVEFPELDQRPLLLAIQLKITA
ncbi:PatU [Dolichospermum sp. FACHB-1091]|nr:PatU [Dolichospermum sp. FACHB-1091]MBD2442161.1 PatU [Dolichospermum sp. FACHB-1091]